jgi:hypothetical protein
MAFFDQSAMSVDNDAVGVDFQPQIEFGITAMQQLRDAA